MWEKPEVYCQLDLSLGPDPNILVGFFDLLRDGFAERGTTARLNGELGAKPPNPVKVSSQIGPGSRHQRCQQGEKVLWSEQNMTGAIGERVLEFVAHLAGCVGRQPLQTNSGRVMA
jgi:hypothetical protein